MNTIALSATSVPPGVSFTGGLFDVLLLSGETAGWSQLNTEFEQWDPALHGPVPEGIRGNSNNIITVGEFVPGGTPFISGTRYFADTVSAGQLTTSINELFVGKAIENDKLLVNMPGAQVWEDASLIVGEEHDILTGRHDIGSARIFHLLANDRFVTSGSDASATGYVLYAIDTGQVFYCLDGATNAWVEANTFTGPVDITGRLEVGNNLILGNQTLDDGGGDTFNVFAHAARHLIGGADPLSGVVNQLIKVGLSGDLGLVQSVAWPIPDQIILTVGFDFGGRPGNSTVLFFSPLSFFQDSASAVDLNAAFFLDTVEITTPNGIRGLCELNSHASADGGQSITLVGWSDTVSAAAHILEVRVGVKQVTTPLAQNRMILALDLGLT